MQSDTDMSNFYTNITLRTSDRSEIVEYMRGQNRPCFISPTTSGYTTVYDRYCEEQDVRELENLASDLSSRLHCLALAALNHDDDVLWVGVVNDGKWVTSYQSDQILSGSAWRLASAFKIAGLMPLVWLLMRWPIVLFEVWRHAAIGSTLGLPKFTVGLGYTYLLRGERPPGENPDSFERVS